MTDVLVVGPGWLGSPVAVALAEAGHQVWTLSRSGSAAPAGCTAVAGDIALAVTREGRASLLARLPHTIRHLVVCVAPSSSRGDSYAIYPAAARGAAALAEALGVTSVVYVSSTGIYDRQDGSEVNEHTLIEPTNDRVQVLFDAERLMLAAATACRAVHVLRAAGLYGPGRDPAARFAAGATPSRIWCNFSWRDDVVSAIAHCLALPPSGAGAVFNCTDNTPVRAGDIAQALTGRPADDTVTAGAAGAVAGPVRAGRSNQRISSAALLNAGWRPEVPDVYAGLRRLGHALPGRDGVS
ncbi:NAD-dependent epimerase/dehydratase family protein [Gemmatimonas sp.]|uniref:NAD-dependent epimerase/dehydratase family protein n=1 Tax=Gemmatimonas sp. TaxID=1962908 RepID=UPI0037BF3C73